MRAPPALSLLTEDPPQLLHYVRACLAAHRRTGDKHPFRMLRGGAFLCQQPKTLPHQPLGAVAVSGVVESPLRNNDAGLTVGVVRIKTPRNEKTPLYWTPPAEYTPVFRAG